MIKKIESNETTKRLIKNVIKQVQTKKPQMKHVNYSFKVVDKHNSAELITKENDGVLENTSIIDINPLHPTTKGIKATIDNTTGAIALKEKPLGIFMSKKTAFRKIQEFLNNLQLKNRLGFNGIENKDPNFVRPGIVEIKEKYKKFDVISKMDASN